MKELYVSRFWVLLLAFACGKKTIPDETTPATTAVRTVRVSTSSELKAALLDAKPGDDIVMADGVYSGKFVIEATAAGTSANPLCCTVTACSAGGTDKSCSNILIR